MRFLLYTGRSSARRRLAVLSTLFLRLRKNCSFLVIMFCSPFLKTEYFEVHRGFLYNNHHLISLLIFIIFAAFYSQLRCIVFLNLHHYLNLRVRRFSHVVLSICHLSHLGDLSWYYLHRPTAIS